MHVPTFTYAPAIEPVNIRLPHRLLRVRHVEVCKCVTQVPGKKLLVLLCKLSVYFLHAVLLLYTIQQNELWEIQFFNRNQIKYVRTSLSLREQFCVSILKNYWTKDRRHCRIIMPFRMIRCPGCSESRSLDAVCTVGGSTRSGTRHVDPSSELDESFFFFWTDAGQSLRSPAGRKLANARENRFIWLKWSCCHVRRELSISTDGDVETPVRLCDEERERERKRDQCSERCQSCCSSWLGAAATDDEIRQFDVGCDWCNFTRYSEWLKSQINYFHCALCQVTIIKSVMWQRVGRLRWLNKVRGRRLWTG